MTRFRSTSLEQRHRGRLNRRVGQYEPWPLAQREEGEPRGQQQADDRVPPAPMVDRAALVAPPGAEDDRPEAELCEPLFHAGEAEFGRRRARHRERPAGPAGQEPCGRRRPRGCRISLAVRCRATHRGHAHSLLSRDQRELAVPERDPRRPPRAAAVPRARARLSRHDVQRGCPLAPAREDGRGDLRRRLPLDRRARGSHSCHASGFPPPCSCRPAGSAATRRWRGRASTARSAARTRTSCCRCPGQRSPHSRTPAGRSARTRAHTRT